MSANDVSRFLNNRSVDFDPAIMRSMAKKLYDKADSIVLFYAVGFSLCAFLGAFWVSDHNFFVSFFIGIFLSPFGYYIGQDRAFKYRLEAQTILCHLQIEKNTRRVSFEDADEVVKIKTPDKKSGGVLSDDPF